MVAFAGDMNGHIRISNVGYDGTHGGFGYGSRNADGSRILEFAAGQKNLVIYSTLFYGAGIHMCGWSGEKYS